MSIGRRNHIEIEIECNTESLNLALKKLDLLKEKILEIDEINPKIKDEVENNA